MKHKLFIKNTNITNTTENCILKPEKTRHFFNFSQIQKN